MWSSTAQWYAVYHVHLGVDAKSEPWGGGRGVCSSCNLARHETLVGEVCFCTPKSQRQTVNAHSDYAPFCFVSWCLTSDHLAYAQFCKAFAQVTFGRCLLHVWQHGCVWVCARECVWHVGCVQLRQHSTYCEEGQSKNDHSCCMCTVEAKRTFQ